MSGNPQGNPQGHATLRAGEKEYRLRLGFSDVADADEYLGRSLLAAMREDPANFHLIRTAFYFAARRTSKLRSIKEAGQVLEDFGDFEAVGEALQAAMRAGGLISDDPDGSSDEAGEGEP